MKELIKPQTSSTKSEMVYEALAEPGCETIHVGCICKSKGDYADPDEQEILF